MSELERHQFELFIKNELRENAIDLDRIEIKEYPDETIYIVYVNQSYLEKAVLIAKKLDDGLSSYGVKGFVVLRASEEVGEPLTKVARSEGIDDVRSIDLMNLCAARSRASEVQPSLLYIPNATNTILAVMESRHHLIFGRRGAGKTALLAEAKTRLHDLNEIYAWMNVQTVRSEGVHRSFLWAVLKVVDELMIRLKGYNSNLIMDINRLREEVTNQLGGHTTSDVIARHYVPKLQRILHKALPILNSRLFLFIDDLHYLPRSEQPLLLDMLHGAFRDTNAWMKVASIRHLTRWFQPNPPMGLQSGNDAAHIDLDLTLESPVEAKNFLDQVLDSFAKHVGFKGARSVFSEDALDRLVLASGAVPRDYLELASASIKEAKKRSNARLVGVQDVNRAAGEQSKIKLQELEDDAAASLEGGARTLVAGLNVIRQFCLDEKRYTYFNIDFREKESAPTEYSIVCALLDMKIVHLISSSLSDKDEAGSRGEVYMLDLSQFSGQRFKKNLWVLDFSRGHLILKKTSSTEVPKVGDSSKKLQQILRRGPNLHLKLLAQV